MEPEQPRRRSTARVRWATAAVAGGALVATGALTVGVAQAHPADAGSASTGTSSTGTSSGDGTTSDGTATDGSTVQPPAGPTSGSTGTQQQLTPPTTVRPGHGGGSHASSGGS